MGVSTVPLLMVLRRLERNWEDGSMGSESLENKCEDLCSNLQHPCKKSGVITHSSSPGAEGGRD